MFELILTGFWEASGFQEIAKNRENPCSGRVWNAFGLSVRLRKGFKTILADLGKIWEVFWKDLASILKPI